MTQRKTLFPTLLFALFSLSCAAIEQATVHALIVVDIDNTLGVQEPNPPAFTAEHIVKVPGDQEGDFYFYRGAIDFLRTVFRWREEAVMFDKKIEVALFTMAFGQRNEIVRNFIEDQLGLARNTLAVYDFSHAVFSEDLIGQYRSHDPGLSLGWRQYLDSLDKPIAFVEKLPDGLKYQKDLSKLLPFYTGLELLNIRLVDDNKLAVPSPQNSQLIVFGPNMDYTAATETLRHFLVSVY